MRQSQCSIFCYSGGNPRHYQSFYLQKDGKPLVSWKCDLEILAGGVKRPSEEVNCNQIDSSRGRVKART